MANNLPINKGYLVSSLKQFEEEVLSKKYSKTHENQSVLDKLSESDDGMLLFDGNMVESSGETGSDGMSAYEIAAKNGFEGTEIEWLDSLKGETGEKGNTGKDGIDGKDGVGIPKGGNPGQVLMKKNDDDYSTEWTDVSICGGTINYTMIQGIL